MDTTNNLTKQTVFVLLLDEGSIAWAPVPAIHISGNIYKLFGDDIYDPETETWEFLPGAYVTTKKYISQNKEILKALAEVFPPSKGQNVVVEVWVPSAQKKVYVPAVHQGGDMYQLQGEDIYNQREGEWEFLPGTLVLVKRNNFFGNDHLFAIAKVIL